MERMRAIRGKIEPERFWRVRCEEEGAPVWRVLKGMGEVAVLDIGDVVVGGLVEQVLLERVHAG